MQFVAAVPEGKTTIMNSKKIIGLILTIGGAGALTYGILTLFSGQFGNGAAWAAGILGLIFFSSGIGLMKSVKPSAE